MKQIDFNWTVVGENNGHPKLRLTLYDDYVAEVANSFADNQWTARLNGQGHRRIPTEAHAKALMEELIFADIESRLIAAAITIERYREPA